MAKTSVTATPATLKCGATRRDIMTRAWAEWKSDKESVERLKASGLPGADKQEALSFGHHLRQAWAWFKTIAADRDHVAKLNNPKTERERINAQITTLEHKNRWSHADYARFNDLHRQRTAA